MKKIILSFEGSNFAEETLEFARQLNALSPVFLAAAFLPEVDYARFSSLSGGIVAPGIALAANNEDDTIQKNSARIREFCITHNIKFAIHTDRFDFALSAIRKETRFSDLLVLSGRHFFENIDADQPNAYMKEILHTTECPILMVPEKPVLPDHLILAYDGTQSSIHAIRQFTYLFPEFSDTPATLVYINDKNDEPLPDESFIEELVSHHFKDLRLLKLKMGPKDFAHTWVADKINPWLITGAYGRSDLSLLFSKSFITTLIKENKIPVFVAHI